MYTYIKQKWLDVARRGNYAASRNYASEHFLSLNTLETIADLKYQYLELLVSIGFVPIDVPRRRKNACDNILTLTGMHVVANKTKQNSLKTMHLNPLQVWSRTTTVITTGC